MARLIVRPLTLEQSNAAVSKWHRHHHRTVGHRFSLGVWDGSRLCGAAIVGRPVARLIRAYSVAEVTRLVTDGTKNACSILYAASARACEAMGFDRIQTYTLDSEPGTSLRASGWVRDAESAGGDWNVPSRGGRRTDQPMTAKVRWSKTFRETGIEVEWPSETAITQAELWQVA